MKKESIRLFAEKLLFELHQSETLTGDFAYSKYKARRLRGKYWLCGHWVEKSTEKCFYYHKKRYYRYKIPNQWE